MKFQLPSSLAEPSRAEGRWWGLANPKEGDSSRLYLRCVPLSSLVANLRALRGPPFSERNAVSKPLVIPKLPSSPDPSSVGCFHIPSIYVVACVLCVYLINLPKRNQSKPFEFLERASVNFCLEDFLRGGMLKETIRTQNSSI